MLELSIKLWEAYRQNPVIPANIGEHRRGALRGVIGAVASVTHLKDTLSSMTSQGYQGESPIVREFKVRLREQEQLLATYEEQLYGAQA